MFYYESRENRKEIQYGVRFYKQKRISLI
jgi:hypothetical protein